MKNIGNLLSAIELIWRKLGQKGVVKVASTCLGHFLDIHTIKFSSVVLQSLLIQKIECDNPKVAEFNFRGVVVLFDKKAFVLVTGLKCGKPLSLSDTNKLTDKLWEKYFGTTEEIHLKELMDKFECHLFNQNEVDDNVMTSRSFRIEPWSTIIHKGYCHTT